jgi:hypothetical protein
MKTDEVMTHGVPLAAAEAEFARLLVRVPARDRLAVFLDCLEIAARSACLELATPAAVH